MRKWVKNIIYLYSIMPRKYVRKRVFKRKRLYNKKIRRNNVSAINPARSILHMPIAPKYFTTFECGATATVASGSAATHYFNVGMTPFEPFNSDTTIASIATLVPATAAVTDLRCAGYTVQAINLYQRVRVWSATITVTAVPTAAADLIYLVLAPYTGSGNQATDTQTLMSQPYAKCITCTGNNNIRQNTLRSSIYMPSIYGFSKQQWKNCESSPSANGVTTAATDGQSWRIMYQTASNAVTTATLSLEVRVKYKVELFEPDMSQAIS